MKTKVVIDIVTAFLCLLGGFYAGQRYEYKEQVSSPKWSAWSNPEIIRPSPPFPQWVIQQYRTNLETRELKAHIITHGTPAGLCEPESAIAN